MNPNRPNMCCIQEESATDVYARRLGPSLVPFNQLILAPPPNTKPIIACLRKEHIVSEIWSLLYTPPPPNGFGLINSFLPTLMKQAACKINFLNRKDYVFDLISLSL